MNAGSVAPVHGGPDALGAVAHDFSTNANGCGPCPAALDALQAADASRYPDPAYAALRERLACFHGVEAGRIVPAASASEFIFRITAAVARTGGRRLLLPRYAYGDCVRAARTWAFEAAAGPHDADLAWCCDPSSPLGQPTVAPADLVRALRADATCVLDLAYEPLRLEGESGWPAALRNRVWQLWTPNKALGLTGIRAAYAIAPLASQLPSLVAAMAPSWPVGAHGVALLEAWTGTAAQHWLSRSRVVLADWKAQQGAICSALGWQCLPGVANFFCARPDRPLTPDRVAALRAVGVQLRDTASFGLEGHVRLGVLAPASQQALADGWRAVA
ncbi:aminotransferase class I/II-fold pyridoxal phosphate-dependent enzyme [Variovorax sp. J22P168]|uniref:aminotransferase class I/II-fold pyridoxal phosphate-dependent enzyme n=1 Tax=Variovorax jilinensis TaxID=3053513 RepID=UPI0025767C80|nr:aminotransferase class I/II-fold pyridoxal phosphate-dependent enzyme [Variovorax sp. J22P168]MDM0013098.1 aminotransferase class I/II-fold pyridoxal phosphate-dependent enzyme [Variovorax sp. J22P168]